MDPTNRRRSHSFSEAYKGLKAEVKILKGRVLSIESSSNPGKQEIAEVHSAALETLKRIEVHRLKGETPIQKLFHNEKIHKKAFKTIEKIRAIARNNGVDLPAEEDVHITKAGQEEFNQIKDILQVHGKTRALKYNQINTTITHLLKKGFVDNNFSELLGFLEKNIQEVKAGTRGHIGLEIIYSKLIQAQKDGGKLNTKCIMQAKNLLTHLEKISPSKVPEYTNKNKSLTSLRFVNEINKRYFGFQSRNRKCRLLLALVNANLHTSLIPSKMHALLEHPNDEDVLKSAFFSSNDAIRAKTLIQKSVAALRNIKTNKTRINDLLSNKKNVHIAAGKGIVSSHAFLDSTTSVGIEKIFDSHSFEFELEGKHGKYTYKPLKERLTLVNQRRVEILDKFYSVSADIDEENQVMEGLVEFLKNEDKEIANTVENLSKTVFETDEVIRYQDPKTGIDKYIKKVTLGNKDSQFTVYDDKYEYGTILLSKEGVSFSANEGIKSGLLETSFFNAMNATNDKIIRSRIDKLRGWIDTNEVNSTYFKARLRYNPQVDEFNTTGRVDQDQNTVRVVIEPKDGNETYLQEKDFYHYSIDSGAIEQVSLTGIKANTNSITPYRRLEILENVQKCMQEENKGIAKLVQNGVTNRFRESDTIAWKNPISKESFRLQRSIINNGKVEITIDGDKGALGKVVLTNTGVEFFKQNETDPRFLQDLFMASLVGRDEDLIESVRENSSLIDSFSIEGGDLNYKVTQGEAKEEIIISDISSSSEITLQKVEGSSKYEISISDASFASIDFLRSFAAKLQSKKMLNAAILDTFKDIDRLGDIAYSNPHNTKEYNLRSPFPNYSLSKVNDAFFFKFESTSGRERSFFLKETDGEIRIFSDKGLTKEIQSTKKRRYVYKYLSKCIPYITPTKDGSAVYINQLDFLLEKDPAQVVHIYANLGYDSTLPRIIDTQNAAFDMGGPKKDLIDKATKKLIEKLPKLNPTKKQEALSDLGLLLSKCYEEVQVPRLAPLTLISSLTEKELNREVPKGYLTDLSILRIAKSKIEVSSTESSGIDALFLYQCIIDRAALQYGAFEENVASIDKDSLESQLDVFEDLMEDTLKNDPPFALEFDSFTPTGDPIKYLESYCQKPNNYAALVEYSKRGKKKFDMDSTRVVGGITIADIRQRAEARVIAQSMIENNEFIEMDIKDKSIDESLLQSFDSKSASDLFSLLSKDTSHSPQVQKKLALIASWITNGKEKDEHGIVGLSSKDAEEFMRFITGSPSIPELTDLEKIQNTRIIQTYDEHIRPLADELQSLTSELKRNAKNKRLCKKLLSQGLKKEKELAAKIHQRDMKLIKPIKIAESDFGGLKSATCFNKLEIKTDNQTPESFRKLVQTCIENAGLFSLA